MGKERGFALGGQEQEEGSCPGWRVGQRDVEGTDLKSLAEILLKVRPTHLGQGRVEDCTAAQLEDVFLSEARG